VANAGKIIWERSYAVVSTSFAQIIPLKPGLRLGPGYLTRRQSNIWLESNENTVKEEQHNEADHLHNGDKIA
jgi:hypothetical protein